MPNDGIHDLLAAVRERMQNARDAQEYAQYARMFESLVSPETTGAPTTPGDRAAMAAQLQPTVPEVPITPAPEYNALLTNPAPGAAASLPPSLSPDKGRELLAFTAAQRAGEGAPPPEGGAHAAPPAPRTAMDVLNDTATPDGGGPLAPDGTPASGPASPVEAYAQSRGLMRGAPGFGALNAASDALSGSTAELDALRAQRYKDLDQAAIDAEVNGRLQATEKAMQEEEYQRQQIAFDEQREKAQGEWKKRVSNYEAAVEDYRKEAAKAPPKSTLGNDIAAAIAIGLGAFGASRSGGPNQALQVIQARINEEAEKRAARLASLSKSADMTDKLAWRAYQATQSVEAARQTARSALLDQAAMMADRYATLNAASDKQAQATDFKNALKVQAAEAKQAADAATLLEVRKQMSRGQGSAMERLKIEHQALENLKLAGEINKNGGEGLEDLDPDTRRRINQIDTAETQLNQLDQMAADMQKDGYDAIPGQERIGSEPGKKLRRIAAETPGVGGLLFSDRGTTGLSAREQNLTSAIEQAAVGTYVAEAENSANRESEYERAYRGVAGNGTLASMRESIARKRALLRAKREDVLRKNSKGLRDLQAQRHTDAPSAMTPGAPPPPAALGSTLTGHGGPAIPGARPIR